MKLKEKERAIKLRRQGYSLNEISKLVDASKGTLSLWFRDVKLSEKARKRIENNLTKGQLKSRRVIRSKTEQKEKEASDYAENLISSFSLNKQSIPIFCAMLYWCEGNKSIKDSISFTNSDPRLVSNFLYLFRKSFNLDETKFRVCMHLHDYHNEKEQLKFWSKVTKIPKEQFIKSYRKPHTGKRIRNNYPGCVRVRYFDVAVARKLLAIARVFMRKTGSIV